MASFIYLNTMFDWQEATEQDLWIGENICL
jgi:hypothetical protein